MSGKITSADCVKAIVDLAKKDGPAIFLKEMGQQATPKDITNITNPRYWKRFGKNKIDGKIYRMFECRPPNLDYEDMLRADVVEDNGVITMVHIEGQ